MTSGPEMRRCRSTTPIPDGDGFERQKRRWIQPRLETIWVDPSNGTIYGNTNHPVEAPRQLGVYRYDRAGIGTDPGVIRPVAAMYPQGNDGRVITGDEKYVYADAVAGGRRVLVRFWHYDPSDTNKWQPLYDWIKVSEFPGADESSFGTHAARILPGTPGGAAAGMGLVFVSMPATNEILVFTREDMKLLRTNTGIQAPTVMAFRSSRNTLFVAQKDSAARPIVREYKVDASGALSIEQTIRYAINPAAMAASADKLSISQNFIQPLASIRSTI